MERVARHQLPDVGAFSFGEPGERERAWTNKTLGKLLI